MLAADFGFKVAYSNENLGGGVGGHTYVTQRERDTARAIKELTYRRYTAETTFNSRTAKIENAPIAPMSTKNRMTWKLLRT